ncbi:MAG: hypothetical protein ABIK96_12820 [bacterium]
MSNIFITGCARSGTTLLNRLFHAFEDVRVIDRETSLDDFISLGRSDMVVVAKRTPKTILSVPLAREELRRQEERVLESRIIVVNIVRDGRDVVHRHPRGPRVDLNRWIGCMLQSRRFRHLISLELRYEDLVQKPDEAQSRIESVAGLARAFRFSEYPDFVDTDAFAVPDFAGLEQYEPRPIDRRSLGHSPTEYLALSTSDAERELFERTLVRMGYAGEGDSCGWNDEQLAADQALFEALSRDLGYGCS